MFFIPYAARIFSPLLLNKFDLDYTVRIQVSFLTSAWCTVQYGIAEMLRRRNDIKTLLEMAQSVARQRNAPTRSKRADKI